MRMIILGWIAMCWVSCGTNTEPKETPSKVRKSDIPRLVQEKVDPALTGSWILVELPQSTTPVNTLFPRQKPFLFIQADQKLVSGSTGCNRFSATLHTDGDKLTISELTRSTLACPGEAEPSFLRALDHADRFSFRNSNEMVWGNDSVTWMVFRKR